MANFSPQRASSAASFATSGAKSVVVESISGRSEPTPVIAGRAIGEHAPIAKPISIINFLIQISSLDASATAIGSAS